MKDYIFAASCLVAVIVAFVLGVLLGERDARNRQGFLVVGCSPGDSVNISGPHKDGSYTVRLHIESNEDFGVSMVYVEKSYNRVYLNGINTNNLPGIKECFIGGCTEENK